MSRSNQLFPKSLVLVTGVVAVGACASLQRNSAATASAIAAESSAFWDAHEEGNSTRLAEFFAQDGTFWPQGVRAINGRDAIGAAAKGMFARLAITDFKVESQDLQVHGLVAYELATFTHILTRKGGQPGTTRGRYLIVWKQGADDRWRIHQLMSQFISGAP